MLADIPPSRWWTPPPEEPEQAAAEEQPPEHATDLRLRKAVAAALAGCPSGPLARIREPSTTTV